MKPEQLARLAALLAVMQKWDDEYRIGESLSAAFREQKNELADIIRVEQQDATAPAAQAPAAADDSATLAAVAEQMIALTARLSGLETVVSAMQPAAAAPADPAPADPAPAAT